MGLAQRHPVRSAWLVRILVLARIILPETHGADVVVVQGRAATAGAGVLVHGPHLIADWNILLVLARLFAGGLHRFPRGIRHSGNRLFNNLLMARYLLLPFQVDKDFGWRGSGQIPVAPNNDFSKFSVEFLEPRGLHHQFFTTQFYKFRLAEGSLV